MPDALSGSTCCLTPAFAFSAKEGDKGLPTRFKFLDWGENKGRTTGARIVVGSKTLACLSVNQDTCACDTVPLDYEHQSVKGHPNYKEDPRHYAAHGAVEVIEGDGVYLSSLDYTPNGHEHAPSYKDVSGVVHTDKDGNLLLVRSVALTQHGDVSGMEFSEHVAALSASSPTPPDNQKPNNQPTTKVKPDEKENMFRDLFIEVLDLKPAEGSSEVTDEQIVAAASNFKEVALSAKQTQPSSDGDDKPGDDDPIVVLNARFDQMEKDRLVDRAVADGKVIPLSAEEIKDTSIATLSAMIGRLKAGEVPTKSTVKDETPDDQVVLSAEDKAMCERLGLSEEDYIKANPKS